MCDCMFRNYLSKSGNEILKKYSNVSQNAEGLYSRKSSARLLRAQSSHFSRLACFRRALCHQQAGRKERLSGTHP